MRAELWGEGDDFLEILTELGRSAWCLGLTPLAKAAGFFEKKQKNERVSGVLPLPPRLSEMPIPAPRRVISTLSATLFTDFQPRASQSLMVTISFYLNNSNPIATVLMRFQRTRYPR